jgi:hypothetical protein
MVQYLSNALLLITNVGDFTTFGKNIGDLKKKISQLLLFVHKWRIKIVSFSILGRNFFSFFEEVSRSGEQTWSSHFNLFSHFHHFTAEPQRLPKGRKYLQNHGIDPEIFTKSLNYLQNHGIGPEIFTKSRDYLQNHGIIYKIAELTPNCTNHTGPRTTFCSHFFITLYT